MNTKIVIRCITEESKGYGHFRRCLLFAETIRKKGQSVSFIINFNTVSINELKNKKFDYFLIPRSNDLKMESSIIKRIAQKLNSKLVLIDMREFSESLSRNIANDRFKTIVFDDAWCRNAYADYIFNGTIVEEYHHYKKINPKTKFFLGSKYFITAPEFGTHKKKFYEIHDKRMYSVVVSLGGSDSEQIILYVVKSIASLFNIKITIITGPFFKNSIKLQKFIKNKNNIIHIHSPNNIWEIFQEADVVISNAGSTLYELAIQRIPTICISIVDHQILYAKQFESLGFAINLGLWKNFNEEKIKNTLSMILENKNKRKNMWMSAKSIIDGRGLNRSIEVVNRLLK